MERTDTACSSGFGSFDLRDSKENLGKRGAEESLAGLDFCWSWCCCCGFGRGPRGPAHRGGNWVDEEGGDVAEAPLLDANNRDGDSSGRVCGGVVCCCVFCNLARWDLIRATSDSSLFSLVHAARSLSNTAV